MAARIMILRSPSQLVELGRGQIVRADDFHCSTLCLASAGEAAQFLTQARESYGALSVPKSMHIFSADSGADAHCQVNNLTLMQSIVYDWLDQTFGV